MKNLWMPTLALLGLSGCVYGPGYAYDQPAYAYPSSGSVAYDYYEQPTYAYYGRSYHQRDRYYRNDRYDHYRDHVRDDRPHEDTPGRPSAVRNAPVEPRPAYRPGPFQNGYPMRRPY